MSRIALLLCSLYAAVIAACFALAFTASGDFKGQFVLLQLPIALQASLLQSLGFGALLARTGWVTAYIALGLPTFGLLYFAGWLIDRLRLGYASQRGSP